MFQKEVYALSIAKLSEHSLALCQKTSSTNEDLLILPALLLYFDIFVTAKQFHNVIFKNDILSKYVQLSSN